MGGDYAPDSNLSGAMLASAELGDDCKIILVGDKEVITTHLKELGGNENDYEIVHASEVIGMSEHPTKALPKKPESSIALGFNLLKENKADRKSTRLNSSH